MAEQEYQRGYFAVKEEGRQEALFQAKVDLLVEVLLPAAGTEFEKKLRKLLRDEQLVFRLDGNTIVDLRILYSADPAGLRQAVRNLSDGVDPVI